MDRNVLYSIEVNTALEAHKLPSSNNLFYCQFLLSTFHHSHIPALESTEMYDLSSTNLLLSSALLLYGQYALLVMRHTP